MIADAASARRLWIIDPSVSTAEDQGVSEILQGWNGSSRIFLPCLLGNGPELASGYDTDGVVLMGSASSVYDESPWIESLSAWLRPLLSGERRLPLLGICFGHQLIAHLAGGRVDYLREDRSKSVGVEESHLRGGRLLVGDLTLPVVVSHCEEVKELPAGYRVTASRPETSVDGLEHDSLPVFSFQFHPEARDDFAVRAGFDPARVDRRVREASQRLLGAFRDLVQRDD